MILDCLEKVLRRTNLDSAEASAALEEILSAQATPAQTAALLVALAVKGETEDELFGMAQALREKTYLFNQYGPVDVGLANTERRLLRKPAEAQAGVAGETSPDATFNISSAVAFVVAGAGVRVLQQGHRSAGNDLESAAVLEALGIHTLIPSVRIAQCVGKAGLGFVFEPLISEAMEIMQFAFQEIPIPTAFNLLLPMLNPGGAPALVLGVPSPALTETVARVATRMGLRRGFVFHGSDGLDEITNTGPTKLVEIAERENRENRIQPGDFGFPAASLEDLRGGGAQESAEIIRAVLEGEPGPRRNVVLLNAAPAIVCGSKAGSLAEGVHVAAQSIDSGNALRVLKELAAITVQDSGSPARPPQ